MTPEAQRIAIAEACGWKGIHMRNSSGARSETGQTPWGIGPNGEWAVIGKQDTKYAPLPNYPADLNAMHEAESKLQEPERTHYLNLLYDEHRYRADSEWAQVHATAAQRAEAWLRVKGLYKEDAP